MSAKYEIPSLTQERLMEVLFYQPDSGVFTWVKPKGNKRAPGEVAGSPDRRGYVTIGIDGGRHLAHRLAILYVHGFHPGGDVDHIDGDKSNNRFRNLRVVSRAVNIRNQRREVGRVFGISRSKAGTKWEARIKADGVSYFLGSFLTMEEAVDARRSAERRHGFSPRHGSSRGECDA